MKTDRRKNGHADRNRVAVFFCWEDDGGFLQDLLTVFAASRTCQSCVFEKKTGAGKAGLGFLKFGDIQRCDVEATSFNSGVRVRKRSGENNRFSQRQGIGGVGLGGIVVDPFEARKRSGVEPGAVGEECVAAEIGDGGF